MLAITRIKGLIYVAGETGVTIDQLAVITGLAHDQIKHLLEKLKTKMINDPQEPCQLLVINHKYQFVTKKSLNSDIQKFFKNSHASILTPAALETLTIIAYRQPITRVEIDNIRGVNSSLTIQKLTQQKLVKTEGHKTVLGNPILYGTTNAFLDLFGLSDLSKLPKISKQTQLFKS